MLFKWLIINDTRILSDIIWLTFYKPIMLHIYYIKKYNQLLVFHIIGQSRHPRPNQPQLVISLVEKILSHNKFIFLLCFYVLSLYHRLGLNRYSIVQLLSLAFVLLLIDAIMFTQPWYLYIICACTTMPIYNTI